MIFTGKQMQKIPGGEIQEKFCLLEMLRKSMFEGYENELLRMFWYFDWFTLSDGNSFFQNLLSFFLDKIITAVF